MNPEKDDLYWQLRQQNDRFLREQWLARRYRRQAALELALDGQRLATELIEALGYRANPTTYKCPFDLWVRDSNERMVRVEVKISTFDESRRRFQANVRHHKAGYPDLHRPQRLRLALRHPNGRYRPAPQRFDLERVAPGATRAAGPVTSTPGSTCTGQSGMGGRRRGSRG